MVKEENPISEVEEDDFDEVSVKLESRMRAERARMAGIFHRTSSWRFPVRVHDVVIRGNRKTKESLIKAEIEAIKTATSVEDMVRELLQAKARLEMLDIFDSVKIDYEWGPPKLPGTYNVIVEVVESKNPPPKITFSKNKQARSWSLKGSHNLKNLFGYGDLWDGFFSYGWDQTTEFSAGVSLPRFMRLCTPVMARVSLLSQDWLKFSSYKHQALGLSLGLLSTKNHDLAYNISWRTLFDPSQMASKSIRRQLGHGLLSHLKYTYTIDRRNSPLRPTRGFAFVSSSQLGGIFPDYRSLRFIRQEFDLRYALSLGFAGAALNFGVAGGVIFPWGSGFLNTPASLPDRFFLGGSGNSSPVSMLGGPMSLWGFKTRGLGPSEAKRNSERDFVGGDLAVTAFADLSFDLPWKVLRDYNIHSHAFACAGSQTKLTGNALRDFSFQKYLDSFRSSAGFGLVIPTKWFSMEANYCYIMRKHEHDQADTGVKFSFTPFW